MECALHFIISNNNAIQNGIWREREKKKRKKRNKIWKKKVTCTNSADVCIRKRVQHRIPCIWLNNQPTTVSNNNNSQRKKYNNNNNSFFIFYFHFHFLQCSNISPKELNEPTKKSKMLLLFCCHQHLENLFRQLFFSSLLPSFVVFCVTQSLIHFIHSNSITFAYIERFGSVQYDWCHTCPYGMGAPQI